MTEQNPQQGNAEPTPPAGQPDSPADAPAPQHMQPYSGGDLPYVPAGPPGQIRSTGICILLYFVTLGFYSWYWYFKVHEDMKRHTQQGLGGGIALILAIFVGIVMPYLTSSETGSMYERDGQAKPVSGATGLWFFPGVFIIVGPFIWFVKTNGALNDYWRSKGAADA